MRPINLEDISELMYHLAFVGHLREDSNPGNIIMNPFVIAVTCPTMVNNPANQLR
jgi:hypothetical protein